MEAVFCHQRLIGGGGMTAIRWGEKIHWKPDGLSHLNTHSLGPKMCVRSRLGVWEVHSGYNQCQVEYYRGSQSSFHSMLPVLVAVQRDVKMNYLHMSLAIDLALLCY